MVLFYYRISVDNLRTLCKFQMWARQLGNFNSSEGRAGKLHENGFIFDGRHVNDRGMERKINTNKWLSEEASMQDRDSRSGSSLWPAIHCSIANKYKSLKAMSSQIYHPSTSPNDWQTHLFSSPAVVLWWLINLCKIVQVSRVDLVTIGHT